MWWEVNHCRYTKSANCRKLRLHRTQWTSRVTSNRYVSLAIIWHVVGLSGVWVICPECLDQVGCFQWEYSTSVTAENVAFPSELCYGLQQLTKAYYKWQTFTNIPAQTLIVTSCTSIPEGCILCLMVSVPQRRKKFCLILQLLVHEELLEQAV